MCVCAYVNKRTSSLRKGEHRHFLCFCFPQPHCIMRSGIFTWLAHAVHIIYCTHVHHSASILQCRTTSARRSWPAGFIIEPSERKWCALWICVRCCVTTCTFEIYNFMRSARVDSSAASHLFPTWFVFKKLSPDSNEIQMRNWARFIKIKLAASASSERSSSIRLPINFYHTTIAYLY